MQCRECHAELPQGARRCPQCGRPVLHEKIWRNKRLRALLIGIAIVLVAVGAGFAVVASQDAAVNNRVKDAICSFQFDTAETLRRDVKLFPAGDNDLRTEIIRTGRLYQAGQYTQTLMYIDDLHEKYTDAELATYSGVLDAMEAKSLPQIYTEAANAYSAQDYQSALAEYTVLAAPQLFRQRQAPVSHQRPPVRQPGPACAHIRHDQCADRSEAHGAYRLFRHQSGHHARRQLRAGVPDRQLEQRCG